MAHEMNVTIEPAGPDQLSDPRRKALVDIFGEQFANTYQGPIMFLDDQSLGSPTSIAFFRRDFAFVSRALHREYQYRNWVGFNQELLDRYNEMITKKLTGLGTLLKNWKGRFNNLMEQNGSKMDDTLYGTRVRTSVPIMSGHARTYFLLLKEVDEVFLISAAANMLGVIDSTQRAQAERLVKKAVRAFAAALRNEVLRLYQEGNRLNRGESTPDPEKVAQQEDTSADLQAFEGTMNKDAKTDADLAVGTADPGALIDEAAAASTAAAKPKSTRAKREAPESTESTESAAAT